MNALSWRAGLESLPKEHELVRTEIIAQSVYTAEDLVELDVLSVDWIGCLYSYGGTFAGTIRNEFDFRVNRERIMLWKITTGITDIDSGYADENLLEPGTETTFQIAHVYRGCSYPRSDPLSPDLFNAVAQGRITP